MDSVSRMWNIPIRCPMQADTAGRNIAAIQPSSVTGSDVHRSEKRMGKESDFMDFGEVMLFSLIIM
jgi:hypothetical protein